jgi:hypothetical protein
MPLQKLPAKMYPGFGLSMLDRAVKEFFAARCSPKELLKLAEHFMRDGNVTCVYCDKVAATRWDHYHPVSGGGDSSPGNLVPACGRCDDSKQDKTIDEWAAGKAKHRPGPDRVSLIHQRIAEYRKEYTYSEVAFETKLSQEDRAIYKRFRRKLEELREQMRADGLISR